ncbi:MAG TPA: permease-like cell division protein FtsX [Candidatus Nitrosocosmicus sp.]|nr:permease-like cell division protein FtsX [Candidatus Nitrosocosmicus sp.]
MKEIFTSIKRGPYQAIASFLILFFTLFLALFFFYLTSFLYGILSYVEGKPQVTVYFQTATSESDIFKIRDTMKNSGKTTSVKYISKQEALTIYRNLNKDNPLLLEMVSSDILPPSLEIYAKKPEYLSEIAEYLRKQPGIDEVEFQKSVVDKLIGVTDMLRKISMFIFAFLMFITIIVLMTTTAFKIALKKEEIEILKLLGASNFYIRKPHLKEGLFFGFVSGTVAFAVFFLIFLYFQPFLKTYLSGLNQLSFYNYTNLNLYVWPPSVNFVVLSYLLIIGFGMLIGFIGHLIASSKYIK